MTKFYEGRWPVEGLIYEEEMSYSRATVVIASGSGKLAPGAVLGKITASGKFKPSPATGTDGSQVAVAILGYAVDATDADVAAVAFVRNAVWNVNTLTYDASVNDAAKKTAKQEQLKAIGIVPR